MAALRFPGDQVKVTELAEYIRHLQENDGFYSQFKNVPFGETDTVTIGKTSYAQEKNRYRHIFPYDHSRVKLLKTDSAEESTYINACYIQHYERTVYIASQGPMLNTIADFWRMVWEQDSPTIVMLANVMEHGKINCNQYWPDKGSETYRQITVTPLKEDIKPQFTVRKFNISQGGETKCVEQFHFTGWIDLNVPDVSTGLLDMRRLVNQCPFHGRGPIIVHCRAGVGRTGTYLAIDYLLKQAKAESHIDVVKCLYQLRSCRMNMIETVPQWRFVYHTVLEALSLERVSVPVSQFSKSATVAEIEQQWQVLGILNKGEVGPSKTAATDSLISASKDVKLMKIKGYSDSCCLFTSHIPVEGGLDQFWRLVIENDIQSIVIFNPLKVKPVSSLLPLCHHCCNIKKK